jgi:hypothetical protein
MTPPPPRAVLFALAADGRKVHRILALAPVGPDTARFFALRGRRTCGAQRIQACGSAARRWWRRRGGRGPAEWWRAS